LPARSELEAIVAAGVPGVVVAASGREAAAGLANVDTGEPLTPRHRFRIGSVSKTFIATVVLQLVDEGALELDGEATPVVPGITVRQLLNHTSGLPDADIFRDPIAFLEPYRRDPKHRWQLSPQELLGKALGQERLFPPGEGWSYSGSNYLALGLLVEETTGSSLPEHVRRRVIEPLGLEETDFPVDSSAGHGLARAYLPADNPALPGPGPGPVDTTELDLPFNWIGGGVNATASDVARFLAALLGGELLPDRLRAELLTTVPSDWPETDEYGLGIGKITSVMREVPSPCGAAWGHLGFSLGYIAIALASEDGSRQAVVMTNGQVMDEPWEALGRLAWSAYCST
jgi:D-alanyl-D-alanine carboxypeptidase